MNNTKPLPLLCSKSEYDAATEEQKKDWERRLFELWSDTDYRQQIDEGQKDHDDYRREQGI